LNEVIAGVPTRTFINLSLDFVFDPPNSFMDALLGELGEPAGVLLTGSESKFINTNRRK
jgi:hypothetical protein